jgi:hypothetical protein
MVYFLQDAGSDSIVELLEFSPVAPINTVYALLETRGGLDMLRDTRVVTATREVADDKRKSRSQLQREIRAKNDAVKALSREYVTLNIYIIFSVAKYLH